MAEYAAQRLGRRRTLKALDRRKRIDERRRLADERAARGRARQFLALQIGMHVLNEIEHGGQCSIGDYTSVGPKWCISYYLGVRRRGQ